jgi:hypothetical protein
VNPPPPLTPSERKLCYVVVGAALLITALPAVSFGIDRAIAIPGHVLEWLQGEWRRLLAGRVPRLTMSNVVSALFTCTAVGTLLILPLHLTHLLRRAHGLSAAALWFWTMIYGVFPALCGGAYFYLGVALLRSGYGSERGLFPFSLGWLILGVTLSILAFRAWRRRQQEEKAARAAAAG